MVLQAYGSGRFLRVLRGYGRSTGLGVGEDSEGLRGVQKYLGGAVSQGWLHILPKNPQIYFLRF